MARWTAAITRCAATAAVAASLAFASAPMAEPPAGSQLRPAAQRIGKTDWRLLRAVPAEFRGFAKESIQRLNRMGATREQKEVYFSALSMVIEHAGGCGWTLISRFSSLLDNPNFRPEMLDKESAAGFASALVSLAKGDEASRDSARLLDVLLKNPNFLPKDFNPGLIEKLLEVRNAAFEERDGCPPSDSLRLLSLVADLFGSQGFKPWMLDTVEAIIRKSKPYGRTVDASGKCVYYYRVDTPDGLEALRQLIEMPGFTPEMLGIVQLIAEKMQASNEHGIRYFMQLAGTPAFKPEMLHAVRAIVEKTGADSPDAMDAFRALLKCPQFSPEHTQKLIEVLETVVEKINNNQNYVSVRPFINLRDLIRNPGFEPWMLDLAKSVIQEQGTDGLSTLVAIDVLLGRAGFEPRYIGRLMKVTDFISRNSSDYKVSDFLNFARLSIFSPAILDDMLFVIERNGAFSALSAFTKVMSNKDFDIALLDDIERWVESDDFEASMGLAYAISVIGRDKTKELQERMGMVYFGRYPKEVLEEAYASLNPNHRKERPLLVAAFCKSDWNKAMYDSAMKLGSLLRYYRVMVFETDSSEKLYDMIEETAENHKKIDTLVIGGHGSPDSIILGYTEHGSVTIDDKPRLASLRDSFVQHPTVILAACSTGGGKKNIGTLLSRVWGATVWAPDKQAAISGFHLDADGKVERVEYAENAAKKFE